MHICVVYLEIYYGRLQLTIEGWKNDPVHSLREAAKMFNPLNEFQVGLCNCKGRCKHQVHMSTAWVTLHIEMSSGCNLLRLPTVSRRLIIQETEGVYIMYLIVS